MCWFPTVAGGPAMVSAQRDACTVLMSWPGLLSPTKTQVSVAGQTQWPFTSGPGPLRPGEQCCCLFWQFTRRFFWRKTILSAFKGLFKTLPPSSHHAQVFSATAAAFMCGFGSVDREGPSVGWLVCESGPHTIWGGTEG